MIDVKPGIFSSGNFYDFSFNFQPTKNYKLDFFSSIFKHTLGWGYLYLWGDQPLRESELEYP